LVHSSVTISNSCKSITLFAQRSELTLLLYGTWRRVTWYTRSGGSGYH
jgi:hypothetical protein